MISLNVVFYLGTNLPLSLSHSHTEIIESQFSHLSQKEIDVFCTLLELGRNHIKKMPSKSDLSMMLLLV